MQELNLETRENQLLRRKEISLVVESDVTPSKEKAAEYIAARLGVDKELIVVSSVEGKYGVHEFLIRAKVYDSKDEFELIEGKKKGEAKKEQDSQSESKENKDVQDQQTEETAKEN